jgi:DNA-binding response OmpR family regulator
MSKVRILIVEDELLVAEDLRITLQKMGHEVVGMAANGLEAVGKAASTHPHLVLMDVRLHGPMDGVEAARRIRSQADIPIIYVTAHATVLASVEMGGRCTRLGKPFSPAQLKAAITDILAGAGYEKVKQTQITSS